MSHNDCKGKSGYQDSSPAMSTRKHAFWVISFDKIWGLKSRHIAVSWAVSLIQLMKVHNMRHTNRILWLRFVSTECIGWAKVLYVLTSPNNCSTCTQYFAWLINVRWSYSLLGLMWLSEAAMRSSLSLISGGWTLSIAGTSDGGWISWGPHCDLDHRQLALTLR